MLREIVARHRAAVLVVGGLAVVATAGTTGAAIAASSTPMIKVCINRYENTMRYVASTNVSCRRGERGVAWNAEGVAGDRGPAGKAGRTILSGTAAPAVGVGVDGDFYLQNPATAPRLYGPKVGGAWAAGVLLGTGTGGGSSGGATTGWEKVVDPTPPEFDQDDPITITSVATCPAGKKATGGGHTTSDPDGFISVVDNGPTPAGAGWSVSAVSYPSGPHVTLTAYAVCTYAN